ncbi:MAG: RnfABCDGE type electron transport complex subunit D [Parvularculaceae bacterium]|nr:RnfABCDGE type electron transport complex subunit D [Parvularculaceae bacterium]
MALIDHQAFASATKLRAIAPALKDPRWFQILALSALLALGASMRAFAVSGADVITIFAVALSLQWAMSMIFAIRFDPKSALITALSLSLLLRAEGVLPLAAAAGIAIGSKFMIRVRGKHIFNPANIGIVAVTLFSADAWTTPGQWGTAVWLAALIAGAGSFVCHRAARLDVPLIFLGAFAALLFARAIWLGDPLTIPMLRLQNGALILFAFFMISDPKTTPDGFGLRAVFAIATAIIAYILTYQFYLPDAIFYALAIVCTVRPLIELFDDAKPYQWGDIKVGDGSTPRARKQKPRLTPAE